MNAIVMRLVMILTQRFTLYFNTRERMIITIEISIMIAPPSIRIAIGVSPAVLATSSAAPGIYSERISALSILIMTTTHRVESKTAVSNFFVVISFVFIFVFLFD